jgi:hypothetical protein
MYKYKLTLVISIFEITHKDQIFNKNVITVFILITY